MCLMVYLGSNCPLQEISPGIGEKPSFYVVLEKDPPGVLSQYKNIYSLMTWQGCGCGFRTEDAEDYDEAYHKKHLEAYEGMLKCLSMAYKQNNGGISVFAYWAGSGNKPFKTIQVKDVNIFSQENKPFEKASAYKDDQPLLFSFE